MDAKDPDTKLIDQRPLVSIGIPVYNGAKYLAQTLDSVCTQSYPLVQIVVTVDRADDGSWEIIQAARKKYSQRQFIVEKNPVRLGMAGNWNRSVDFATGDFVKVMGQDDILEPNGVAEQVRFLQNYPDCMLVASACRIVRHNGRPVMTRCRFPEGTTFSRDEILNRCLSTSANLIGEPVTVLTRATAYAGVRFDPAFEYYTDLELWLRLARSGSVGFMAAPLCRFRVHRTACSWGQQRHAYQEFLRLESQYPNHALPKPSLHRVVRWVRGQLLILARTGFYRIFG